MLPRLTTQSPTRPPVRFGLAGGVVERGFDILTKNRTREMLLEDFAGFGVLRTGVDLLRGPISGSGELSPVVAQDRMFREITSIFTDNILSGIVAYGFGKVLDKRWKAYSNGWSDEATLKLFQELATFSEDDFLNRLTERIRVAQPGLAPEMADTLNEALRKAWNTPGLSSEARTQLASDLAGKLKLKSFDIRLQNGQRLTLDNLLDDVRLFGQQMAKLKREAPGQAWDDLAKGTLKNTLRIKNIKLACLGVGLGATAMMPLLNVWKNRKLFGIRDYVGDTILKPKPAAPQAPMMWSVPVRPAAAKALTSSGQPLVRSRAYERFRVARFGGEQDLMGLKPLNAATKQCNPNYVWENLKAGNWMPLLGAVLPLSLTSGLFFDTVNRKFMNPFKTNLKRLFDYSKSAPFTTQQQMASMFGLLITSRLLCSQSGNEYRERLVDSGLGWVVWILATPFLKGRIARWFDANRGTQLLKDVGGKQVLRSKDEIRTLLPKLVSPEVAANTLSKYKRLSMGSTAVTVLLLGIVEPLLGILWTKHNTRKKATQPPTLPLRSDWPVAQPFSPQAFQGFQAPGGRA